MGAEPWMYFTRFQSDIERALQNLRQREFEAGRYFPILDHLPNVIDDTTSEPALGAQHHSIEEAMFDAGPELTKSILDIQGVSDQPEMCSVYPIDKKDLIEWYDTDQPTREMLEQYSPFFDTLDRLMGCYIIAHKDGQPDEIMFAGYSAD